MNTTAKGQPTMSRTSGWITGHFSGGTEYLTVMGSAVRRVTIHGTKEAALADPNQLWDTVVAPVERLGGSIFRVTGEWEVRAQDTACSLCYHRIEFVRSSNDRGLPGWQTPVVGAWKCFGRPRYMETSGHLPQAWAEGQVA